MRYSKQHRIIRITASSRWATAVIRREYDAIGRLARLSNITAITEALPFDGVTGLHGAIAPTA